MSTIIQEACPIRAREPFPLYVLDRFDLNYVKTVLPLKVVLPIHYPLVFSVFAFSYYIDWNWLVLYAFAILYVSAVLIIL